MKSDVNVSWSFLGSPRSTQVSLDVPDGVSATAPLVILLHGTSGNVNDMSNPAASPGLNHERVMAGHVEDRGWHAYPNIGFWSLGADPLVDVTGWAPFLSGAGFPTINYGQIQPRGLLAEPVAELRAVLAAIDTDARFNAVASRRIVLLGHSRGGILARLTLVQLAVGGVPILSRIRTCITLHSPNQGSTLANTALGLATAVTTWRVTGIPGVPPELKLLANLALGQVLDLVVDFAGAPAYADFAVGAPTLALLAAAEPVPGVSYYTFGGTRPVLFNLRGWAFTPASAIPQLNLPPFHWWTAYVPVLPVPPPGALPFPEILEGGDVLTNSALTRLPFAPHRDNYLNHAEALWNPALMTQIQALLGGRALPQILIVTRADADTAADPDFAIDAIGGIGPTGAPWRLNIAQALAMADGGTAMFVRGADSDLVPIQRVRRRDGFRYLRAKPGAGGTRLADLPRTDA